MELAIAILVGGLLAIGAVACLETGYHYGVKETERRWSEAVNRAEAHRAAEKAAREKAEAERDELALLTVPSDEDAQVAGRLRIAEARVEELEMLLIEASCIRPGVHVPMLQCVCGAGRPCEEVVRILARSAKGGANG